MKIFTLWEALKQGKRLANAETWKNRQMAINALVGVFGGLILLLPLLGLKVEVSSEDVLAIAGGIATLYGVVDGVLTAATSKKTGLPSKPETGEAAGIGD